MPQANEPLITPGTPAGVLTVEDVIRLFHEEARKRNPDAAPVQPNTVWQYLYQSKPAKTGGKPRRYENNPMPAPQRMAGTLWWTAGQEGDLRAWWNSRDGVGHGRGGNWRNDEGVTA